MTLFGLTLLVLAVVIALKHALHVYRYKNDPFYRLRADEAIRSRQFDGDSSRFKAMLHW